MTTGEEATLSVKAGSLFGPKCAQGKLKLDKNAESDSFVSINIPLDVDLLIDVHLLSFQRVCDFAFLDRCLGKVRLGASRL